MFYATIKCPQTSGSDIIHHTKFYWLMAPYLFQQSTVIAQFCTVGFYQQEVTYSISSKVRDIVWQAWEVGVIQVTMNRTNIHSQWITLKIYTSSPHTPPLPWKKQLATSQNLLPFLWLLHHNMWTFTSCKLNNLARLKKQSHPRNVKSKYSVGQRTQRISNVFWVYNFFCSQANSH